MYVCAHVLCCVWLFVTQWTVAARILCLQNFPGKNIRMGFHLLLQGIFLTQGSHRTSCILCLLLSPALMGRFFTTVPPGESSQNYTINVYLDLLFLIPFKKKKTSNYLHCFSNPVTPCRPVINILMWNFLSLGNKIVCSFFTNITYKEIITLFYFLLSLYFWDLFLFDTSR